MPLHTAQAPLQGQNLLEGAGFRSVVLAATWFPLFLGTRLSEWGHVPSKSNRSQSSPADTILGQERSHLSHLWPRMYTAFRKADTRSRIVAFEPPPQRQVSNSTAGSHRCAFRVLLDASLIPSNCLCADHRTIESSRLQENCVWCREALPEGGHRGVWGDSQEGTRGGLHLRHRRLRS